MYIKTVEMFTLMPHEN